MNVLVFEDYFVNRLYPITIGRPAFGIGCGGYRLSDLLADLSPARRAVVRSHLAAVVREDFPGLTGELKAGRPLLLLNARLVPSVSSINALREWTAAARPGVVRVSESIAAAYFPPSAPAPPAELKVEQLDDFFAYAGLGKLPATPLELQLFDYPHDVVRHHMRIFGDNLAHRLSHGTYREIADGVFAAEGAKLGQYIVSETSKGPIVLDANASVGPYTYLSGPALIGANSRVLEHAAIKDAVAIGHTAKIGGEVEASIIEPYTNKQHHGFLGHSYLGSWINLGAGTCNSDLKNTYGHVKMDYRGERVSTGMQFVGCFMGDYAKTAINTGIFTGKTVGACSMLYGFVTTNVPSFVNYARSFGQVTELPPDVMIAAQERMFARRNVRQRPCDIQLLTDMYRLTQSERQLAGEPLSL